MRAVIQRVSSASVTVDDEITGEIEQGLLVLLGAGEGDEESDLDYVLEKTINMRIFPNEDGKMNLSLLDIDGELLVVSQFTLYGDARKGRRPSFVKAMRPDVAEEMYERFIDRARARGVRKVATGRFGAMMDVRLLNDGPVTILLDSTKAF
ncbi:MAG: D-aminoacyl-tRNA deacylase [Myxococcota bacterium]|nr:D-aminoacyl-tRNA deacylase [Myxococcota bacterium]MEC9442564.1 D-aminoacyl-tRNA deacylase [Myxococcota bacterium]